MNEATFRTHLQKSLAPLYIISSDETLLAIEAVDAIRHKARTEGFSERDSLSSERSFKWEQFSNSLSEMSLFGDKKIIELTIATGKPGKEGAEVLSQLPNLLNDGVVVVLILPRLDAATKKTAWVKTLETIAVWVDIPLVTREEMPRWLKQRCTDMGYQIDSVSLDFLSSRTEGNLLAAKQELQKLALLYPSGTLSLEHIQDVVMDVARYDPFKLYEPLLKRDAARLVRMLQGLEAEGTALTLVVWTAAEEIRTMLKLKEAQQSGGSLSTLMREMRVWGDKEKLMPGALKNFKANMLRATLANLLEVDKAAKGIPSERFSGSPWMVLQTLMLRTIQ